MTYRIIRRHGQKSLRMHFDKEGNLVVSVPFFTPEWRIRQFVEKNIQWIEKHKIKKENRTEVLTRQELEKLIIEKVNLHSSEMNISIPDVSFYDASSYWGVCYPAKKKIRFSWKCCFLYEKQADYIVVHELCHLLHSNHGAEFWKTVEKYCPDFREIKKSIKDRL